MPNIVDPHELVWSKLACASMALRLTTVPAIAQSQTWIEQFVIRLCDAAFAGAPDAEGRWFVAGQWKGATNVFSPTSPHGDILLARFDSDGRFVTIRAQVWARDSANQDGFLLSDGLEATICP